MANLVIKKKRFPPVLIYQRIKTVFSSHSKSKKKWKTVDSFHCIRLLTLKQQNWRMEWRMNTKWNGHSSDGDRCQQRQL